MNIDIPWSVGFIIGAACTGLVVKALSLGLHSLVQMAIVVCVGVGCGWLTETLWKRK